MLTEREIKRQADMAGPRQADQKEVRAIHDVGREPAEEMIRRVEDVIRRYEAMEQNSVTREFIRKQYTSLEILKRRQAQEIKREA